MRKFPYPVTVQSAKQIQEELRKEIELNVPIKKIKIVAGADVSTNKGSSVGFAGVVALTYPEMQPMEKQGVSGKLSFPYVPGLLAFREAPLLLEAIKKLKSKPDIFFFDGHGIAHPKGIGLASHMGILIDRPAIGCAKSRLIGEFEAPPPHKGSRSGLLSRDGKQIGCVLQTKDGCKPIFISEGHKSNLKEATEIVLNCCGRYRIPEPTRQAHIFVNELRKRYL